MMAEPYEQNFGSCELGERRLNRRALSSGQALSQPLGQARSTVFEPGQDLNRADEVSPLPTLAFNR